MTIRVIKKKQFFIFEKNDTETYQGTFHLKKLKQIKQLYKDNFLISESSFHYKFPFNAHYTITLLPEKEQITLKVTSFIKAIYICSYKNDVYKFITHKGTKTSIFKNDIQIGYWQEKTIEFLGANVIEIILNNDVDEILISSIFLTLKCDFENDYSTFSVNIGNIGPEDKPFDKKWTPS